MKKGVKEFMNKAKDFFTKSLGATLATVLALSPVFATPVYAAKDSADGKNNTATSKDLQDSDIIDSSKKGSLTIHKYDITAAQAAGAYTEGSRIANGEQDTVLEQKMADYAIEGVQFTYLRVGNIETYSNTHDTKTNVEVVYEIPTELADILGLTEDQAYDMNAAGVSEKCTNAGVLHYTSTQLADALEAKLSADTLGTRTALEKYVHEYRTVDDATDDEAKGQAVDMPLTNAQGVTSASNLELGLYLLLETEVPEQVTDTTNPWFVSLPFTNITPNEGGTGSQGGDKWMYDMVVYPKNQTGNPTLDKNVRNAYSGTGAADKNGEVFRGNQYDYRTDSGQGGLVVYNDENTTPGHEGDKTPEDYVANRGGYTKDGQNAGKGVSYDYEYRDTNTVSAGDILDYTLVSKMPRITSASTFLTEYTFTDILSAGLTYNKDVKIAFYDNKADAQANNTKNAKTIWKNADGHHSEFFEVVKDNDADTGADWTNGSNKMTVKITEEGLKVLNGEGVDGNNIAGQGEGQVSNKSYSDMYMVVYYTVTVNQDDSLIIGDEGNPNSVVLTWKRTSDEYWNTLEDKNYVYAYSIDLTKHFSDNKGDMSKVQFKLYNETDAYYVIAQKSDEDGVYYVTGKTVNKEEATPLVPDENGKFIVYGLEADTYGLTEITTDNGYTLLEDSIRVAITPTDRDIIASVAGTTGMDSDAIDAIIKAYQGGIYNENGQLVNASTDELLGGDGARPAVQTANGRTIGKTDMFVGAIKPATAQVDDVDADMASSEYTLGNKPDKHTSANATVVLDVVNNKNFLLPATGGYGTIVFVVLGCAALAGGVLLITKKSKKKEK